MKHRKLDRPTTIALICIAIFYVVPAYFIGFTNFLAILSGTIGGLIASVLVQAMLQWRRSLFVTMYGEDLADHAKAFSKYMRKETLPTDKEQLVLYESFLDISEAQNMDPKTSKILYHAGASIVLGLLLLDKHGLNAVNIFMLCGGVMMASIYVWGKMIPRKIQRIRTKIKQERAS